MSTLSICMIVKNEEKLLAQSIETILPVADELIIVDTGSTDKTVEIAKKHTQNVHFFPWKDDFSAAYNYSHSFATCDFVCRWDADFFLKDNSVAKLLEKKERNFDDANLIELRWNIEFGDDRKPTKYIYRMMIAKRGQYYWKYPVHASPVPHDGVKPHLVTYSDIEIDHKKDRKAKEGRYSQTAHMLTKALEGDYTDDPYLLFTGAEVHIFDKNYSAAISLLNRYLQVNTDIEEKNMLAIEKLVHCYLAQKRLSEAQKLVEDHNKFRKYPRFLLLMADMQTLSNIVEAKKLYLEFLKQLPQLRHSPYSYDMERYEVHPYLMLAKISFQHNHLDEAEEWARHVITNSHVILTKFKAQNLIDSIHSPIK